MAIRHIAKETPVCKERLIATKAMGRSIVKLITFIYGFIREKSSFATFSVLFMSCTFLACEYNDFIHSCRLNAQSRKCSNIFGSYQGFKSGGESADIDRFGV